MGGRRTGVSGRAVTRPETRTPRPEPGRSSHRGGERKASSGRPSPDATERCAVQSYFLGLPRLVQTKPQPPSACAATALVRKPGSRPPACAVEFKTEDVHPFELERRPLLFGLRAAYPPYLDGRAEANTPCLTLFVEEVLDPVLNALAMSLSQGPFVSIPKIRMELTAGLGLVLGSTRRTFDAVDEALDQGVIPKEAAVAAVDKVLGAFSEISGGVPQLL